MMNCFPVFSRAADGSFAGKTSLLSGISDLNKKQIGIFKSLDR